MKIFNSINEIENIEPTALALGNFDGIHLGHKALIETTVNSARSQGIKPAVFTFANHPRNIIAGENIVKNIIYFDEKAKIIKDLGVDYLFNIPFDLELMNMTPKEFVENLLIKRFNMKSGYCGFNYRFGKNAAGTPETLKEFGKNHNFSIDVLDPVIIDGQIVSSTLIRELITEGKVVMCLKYLGRLYAIDGEVVVGHRLGKTIGFPTSNLIIDEDMVSPANGVYITICIYNGVEYPSITNVGVKPTIGINKKNVETHIFGFENELYGKNIRVEFLIKTRDERKFESIDELASQITRDCIAAKAYFSK